MNCLYNPVSECASLKDSQATSIGEGVLIMDPCPATALGIKQVLAVSCGITGPVIYAQNLADLSSLIASAQPGLLIMDICGEYELMLNGLRFLAHMREVWPMVKIVICTDFSDSRILELLVASHTSGVLLKHEPILALTQCIDSVNAGSRKWLSPKIKQLLSTPQLKNARLTTRELDILTHLLSGMSVTQVAQSMFLNVRTVSTHKRKAMLKLGLLNDSELFYQGTRMVKTGYLITPAF